MKLIQRTICPAVVLLVSVLVADAQLAGQEVTATISGLFRDADTGQYHNTTLDLFAEIHEPTGQWELVADEQYEFELSVEDAEGERVAEVTIRDPEGEIIDQATADPPVSSLIASGSYTAEQIYPLNYGITVEVGFSTPNIWNVKIGVETPGPTQPRPPTQLVVSVRDMTQGPPGQVPTNATADIWPVGQPKQRRSQTMDWEGKFTFSPIPPGEWMVHLAGCGPSGHCDYDFASIVVLHQTTFEFGRLWSHWPIGGKIWFKNELGQVIPGNPQGITLVLLKNGEPVQGVIPVVNTTQNQDGSYNYTVPSEALLADDYVLRATFAETTHNENVTYPNDCADVLPDPPFTHNTPGAHTPVEGPDFTFIIEEEPPPEP